VGVRLLERGGVGEKGYVCETVGERKGLTIAS
jgi:hypothetical protein